MSDHSVGFEMQSLDRMVCFAGCTSTRQEGTESNESISRRGSARRSPWSAVQDSSAKARQTISQAVAKHLGSRSVHKRATLCVQRTSGSGSMFCETDVAALKAVLSKMSALGEELQGKSKASRFWTKSTVAAELAAVEQSVAELVKHEAAVSQGLRALEAQVAGNRSKLAKLRKAEAASFRKRVKPWMDLGLPHAWAVTLADLGLLSVTGPDPDATVVEDTPADPPVEAALAVAYVPTIPSVESNKVDWQRPLRMVPDVVADLSVDLGQVLAAASAVRFPCACVRGGRRSSATTC